jgi:hypothetical protein
MTAYLAAHTIPALGLAAGAPARRHFFQLLAKLAQFAHQLLIAGDVRDRQLRPALTLQLDDLFAPVH